MSLLSYFDNVFYRICLFYKKHEPKDDSPQITALILISVMQNLNLGSIVVLLFIDKPTHEVSEDKIAPYAIGGFVLFLLLNGYRYGRKSSNFDVLHERWRNKSKRANKWGVWATRAYFGFTVVLIFVTIFRNDIF